MALAGQAETQAPQPVQRSAKTITRAHPPGTGRKRSAASSQAASQTRQVIPCVSRQAEEISARTFHAGAGSPPASAPVAQASTQPPQKVQPPREKSTCGKAPAPGTRIDRGHARMQASQPSQATANIASSAAQGGRWGDCSPVTLRKKPRRSRFRGMPRLRNSCSGKANRISASAPLTKIKLPEYVAAE